MLATPTGKVVEPHVERATSALRDRRLWQLSIGSVLVCVAQLCLVGFIVLFLHDERDVAPQSAALVLAASQLVGGAFRIGGGIWSDRIGRRIDPFRQFALALTVTLALVTALTDAPLALLLPALVLATGTSMGWNSLSFAAAAELGGPARSGAAIGVQQTALALAASIVPLGFAVLVARWSWQAAFAVAAVFPLAGWLVLRPLGERRALAGGATVSFDLLTDEQREIRDLVRTLAQERIAPRAAEIDESHEFPWDVVELFREHDIFAPALRGALRRHRHRHAAGARRDRGGLARSARRRGLILAVQELGSLGLKLAGHGRAEASASCRGSPRGEVLAAYALTEAGAGLGRARRCATRARRDGDEYVIDGGKRFITNAGVAGLYTVFAQDRPGGGAQPAITAFVVEAGHARVRGVAARAEDGHLRARPPASSSSTAARVPAANRLGEEGEGFRIAMRILDRSRPGIAAQGLGIAQGATDYALEYARTRETMGKPIGEHQLIAAKLADMETKCEAARGLLYRFGLMADAGVEGPELTKASAQAKLVLLATSRWRSRPRPSRSSAGTAT